MFFRKIFLALSALFLLVFTQTARAADVVLYSSNQPELIDMVSKGFEKQSGIRVTAVRLGTGEAMKRLAAEKNNPLADIFWSGDVAVLEAARDNFTPYDSPEARQLAATSPAFVAPDKIWTASNTQIMILMANTRLVKEADLPKSWADILDPKWKGKVVMADPAKSGSSYAQLYGIYKLYGWEGVRKLVGNVRILDGSSLVYKGTAEGEFPVGITMEYAAYRYVAGGTDAVKIIYPTDGAISAPEGLALVKGGKNAKEAQAFFDYLISRDVVSEIYQMQYRRPARSDALNVPGLPPLSELRTLDFNPGEANALQKELLGKWRELVLEKK